MARFFFLNFGGKILRSNDFNQSEHQRAGWKRHPLLLARNLVDDGGVGLQQVVVGLYDVTVVGAGDGEVVLHGAVLAEEDQREAIAEDGGDEQDHVVLWKKNRN